MVWRRREEDDVRAGIVAPSAAGVTGRLRAGHASLDRDAIACAVVSEPHHYAAVSLSRTTCFPLSDALADFDNLTGGFMTRATLAQI